MTTVLSLLLLVLLALLGWLLYREYRVGKSRRLPLYTEALIDLLEGRMKEAFEKLKETVNQDSDNVDAYLRLAALLRERGQAERASRIYQMLAVRRNLVPADEQRVLLALAREHLSQKRVNRAVSVLEQVSERNPKDLTSRELLLHIYLEQERWEDVEPVLKALVGLQKDRTRAALYYTAAATRLAGQNPVQAGRYLLYRIPEFLQS
ncbi:MAG: tetratricopeptide repeat protein, partial [candidate division WOR-3 bacterium]